jgi:hypothetical protein
MELNVLEEEFITGNFAGYSFDATHTEKSEHFDGPFEQLMPSGRIVHYFCEIHTDNIIIFDIVAT